MYRINVNECPPTNDSFILLTLPRVRGHHEKGAERFLRTRGQVDQMETVSSIRDSTILLMNS